MVISLFLSIISIGYTSDKERDSLPTLSVTRFSSKIVPIPFPILYRRSDEQAAALIISGQLPVNWTILYDLSIAPSNSEHRFEFRLPILKEKTLLSLKAIDPNGNIFKEYWLIKKTYAPTQRTVPQEKASEEDRKTSKSLLLGYSNIHYQQDLVPDIKINALTLKANYSQNLSRRWSVGANFYINLLPISTSGTTESLRFWGMNIRGGYLFPIDNNIDFRLLGGVFIAGMMTSSETIGYSLLLYPHLYPIFTFKLKNKDIFNFYTKWTPLGDGFVSFSTNEMEIATGFSYIDLRENKHSFIYALDYSKISVKTNSNIQIKNDSLSFSLGYGF